ncbi:polyprotein [Phanerochaete sordida]|uniref:Polyprotein n=1 Tax=Phanerochaete sordida TaxID=48140 RepID=A0A9P3GSD6_9APHY|nr:polyprotein [Phanerochaete sordida]
MCTPEGRLPDPQKVDKILNWPRLRNAREVRGFLGLCGTVRIWIKNYSLIARPLTELVRQDADFVWDERRQAAFQRLKTLVTAAPALHTIQYELDWPIVLSVDSSNIAVGFILSQRDDKGKKRPARYGSLPMNEREARYSQPKLELYGLFRALRAFRIHLVGAKKLQVEVDAKYIKGILLFDFELLHVPATGFKAPDALSRRGLGPGETIETDEDDWVDDIALLVREQHLPVPTIMRRQPGRYVLATFDTDDRPQKPDEPLHEQDRVLIEIYDYLTQLALPGGLTEKQQQRFISRAHKFFVQNGALFKRAGPRVPKKCIFNPARRRRLLQAAHDDLGHRGERATLHTLHLRFYWPTMPTDCQDYVRSCHECQVRSVRKVQTPLLISAPTNIFVKIHLDVMFMPRSRGLRYVVAATDDLSGAGEGRALSANTANLIAKFLWEEIFCRYGAVGQITTDNGSEVQAAVTRLMDRWHIPRVTISPYNSKANGVVERRHFIIRESIIKACEGNTAKWPDFVHHAFFADRITIRRATGFSPYQLLYGTDPVLPFDLSEASFLIDGFTRNMSTTDLLAARIRQLEKRPQDIARAAATLKASRIRSKEVFERRFASRLVSSSYAPGTLVLMRNSAISTSHSRKHQPRYLGPYQVLRRTERGSYVIQELDGSASRHGVAADRLVPYITRGDQRLLKLTKPDPYEDDDEPATGSDVEDPLA